MASATLRVEGMCCADEVALVEQAVQGLPGLGTFDVNLLAQRLSVRYDATRLSEAGIVAALGRVGLRATREDAPTRPEASWARWLPLILLLESGVAIGLGAGVSLGGGPRSVAIVCYLVGMVTAGYPIAWKGLRAAWHRTLDMNFLMTIATIGAVAIGEWFEGATVIWLFALAEFLESYSMGRARRAIQALMELAPPEATVRRDGREERVPVAEVKVGEAILVRPGEKIPLDGRVIGGGSWVNQAPITGESMPVEKGPGTPVYAGTLNERGALEIEVTHRPEDTTLARIIHLVEQAQGQRAPAQRFVDRFARVYTPLVIAGAILVAAVPPLLGQPFVPWFYRALVMLVIACPCALVISTPVSIVSGLAAAARRGVLIKGGTYLEALGRLRAIAFDKTGTLTVGRPQVTDVVPLGADAPEAVLAIAAAVEARSEHPLAAAILRRAREAGGRPPEVEGFEALPGRGARGRVNGTAVHVGNHRLIEELGVCRPEVEARAAVLADEGKTVVFIAGSGGVIGLIGVADQIRRTAPEAVQALRELGIGRLIMLTGDNARTAEAVRNRLGLTACLSELLPEAKVEAVRELARDGGQVAMVGDGVNDAPAMAVATVGIAIGAAATDVALETADVALMTDDLTRLPLAIALSRRTRRVIVANVVASLATKAAFLGLAIAGLATLWMAILADMGTSLAVIANALRLLRAKARVAASAGLALLVGAALWPGASWAHGPDGGGAPGIGAGPIAPTEFVVPWIWRPAVLLVLGLLGAVYATGWGRLRMRAPRVAAPWRLAVYLAGLGAIGLALVSPVHSLGSVLFLMHMVQHELLIMIAAPLLLLAEPLPVMLWGLPRGARRAVARLLRRGAPVRRALRVVTWMPVAWGVYVVHLWAWHLPAAYEAALRSSPLHDLEHLGFFGTALLFWWPIVGPAPRLHGFVPYGFRILYVLAATFQNTILGAVIALTGRVLVPQYATVPRVWALSPLEDQAYAGGIMWEGGAMYLVTLLILVARMLDRDERLTRQREAAASGARRAPPPPAPKDPAPQRRLAPLSDTPSATPP